MTAHPQICVLLCSPPRSRGIPVGLQGAVRHPGRPLTLTIQSDRYAKYYKEDGMDKRTLYKVFGIRFDILVNGKVSVARRWGRPRIPGTAVPCPQEGISPVTQHQGLVGQENRCEWVPWVLARSQQPLGSAGEGNTERSPSYRLHLSAPVRSVVLSQKTS